MPTTKDLSGSGIGWLCKQAKPKFKPIARRSQSSGVNKAKQDEAVCQKALEAMSLDDVRTAIASHGVAKDDVANRSLAGPTITPKTRFRPKKRQQSERVIFSLMATLPKYGLRFPERETSSSSSSLADAGKMR